MANAVAAVLRYGARTWPQLVRHWPRVVATLGVVVKFVQDHPEIPAWFRTRLEDVPKRLADVQRRRGLPARIRGTLDIVRDVALDAAQAHGGHVTAEEYLRRADGIDRGVRLAEALPHPARREQLGRLKEQTDVLLSDLLEVVAHGRPGQDGDDRPE